jgi:AP-1 complex subunit sigma 1/2
LRYVEVLDKYFGSVCELDIIFNFEKAYYILDELILGGEMQVWRSKDFNILNHVSLVQETSKKAVLSHIEQEGKFQEEEIVELALKDIGFI